MGTWRSTEILRWQAFALRRPALPQDDGGFRGLRDWLAEPTSRKARDVGYLGLKSPRPRSLALLGMTTAGILMGTWRVQRFFVGRPSRCEGLRFLRMTAGGEDVADFRHPHLEDREMWGTRLRNGFADGWLLLGAGRKQVPRLRSG